MEIKGDRIFIKPLELEDVFHMRNWSYNDNPLLEDYNCPILTDKQIGRWYKFKVKSFSDKYYGIHTYNDILIGYMGIKNIRRIFRESTLGIVFDPDYVNQGYGSEALELFLQYYFNKMKMKKMYLEVAQFNTRAKRVYEKIGFKSIGYYLDGYPNENLDFANKYYLESKSSFVISDGKIYNYIYKMELNRDDFLKKF